MLLFIRHTDILNCCGSVQRCLCFIFFLKWLAKQVLEGKKKTRRLLSPTFCFLDFKGTIHWGLPMTHLSQTLMTSWILTILIHKVNLSLFIFCKVSTTLHKQNTDAYTSVMVVKDERKHQNIQEMKKLRHIRSEK